jgi:hypothetical protein
MPRGAADLVLLQAEMACWNLFSPSNVGADADSGAGAASTAAAVSRAATSAILSASCPLVLCLLNYCQRRIGRAKSAMAGGDRK